MIGRRSCRALCNMMHITNQYSQKKHKNLRLDTIKTEWLFITINIHVHTITEPHWRHIDFGVLQSHASLGSRHILKGGRFVAAPGTSAYFAALAGIAVRERA